MKVGVIVSNPEEEVVSMFEVCVKTKASSSLSSGMLKGLGPDCELVCLRPRGIKWSLPDTRVTREERGYKGYKGKKGIQGLQGKKERKKDYACQVRPRALRK
eukprot:860647-Pelagomonas_calceolata.AAC.1